MQTVPPLAVATLAHLALAGVAVAAPWRPTRLHLTLDGDAEGPAGSALRIGAVVLTAAHAVLDGVPVRYRLSDPAMADVTPLPDGGVQLTRRGPAGRALLEAEVVDAAGVVVLSAVCSVVVVDPPAPPPPVEPAPPAPVEPPPVTPDPAPEPEPPPTPPVETPRPEPPVNPPVEPPPTVPPPGAPDPPKDPDPPVELPDPLPGPVDPPHAAEASLEAPDTITPLSPLS